MTKNLKKAELIAGLEETREMAEKLTEDSPVQVDSKRIILDTIGSAMKINTVDQLRRAWKYLAENRSQLLEPWTA